MTTRVQVLKQYFGSGGKPVTNAELIDLRRADSKGFDELVEGAAKELGVELEKKPV